MELALNVEKPSTVGLIDSVHCLFLLRASPSEPASLRRVAGFPGLGLLRRLRPCGQPSLDSKELAGPLPTGGCTQVPVFRRTTREPGRRLALPLGVLAASRDEGIAAAPLDRRLPSGSVSRTESHTMPLPGRIGADSRLPEASDTSFVASPLGSVVARRAGASPHPDISDRSAVERDRCWISPITQRSPYPCAHLTRWHLLSSAGRPSVRHAGL